MFNPKQHSLSEIVRQFKTFSARRINTVRGTPGAPVWQRNYYRHVVRNQGELDDIQQHILLNPSGWENNCESFGRLFFAGVKTGHRRHGFDQRPENIVDRLGGVKHLSNIRV